MAETAHAPDVEIILPAVGGRRQSIRVSPEDAAALDANNIVKRDVRVPLEHPQMYHPLAPWHSRDVITYWLLGYHAGRRSITEGEAAT